MGILSELGNNQTQDILEDMDKLLIAQIDKYFSENIDIDGRSVWDLYRLNYEHLDKESIYFKTITIHYHTWEGNKMPYHRVYKSITIPFESIFKPVQFTIEGNDIIIKKL